MKFLNIYKKTFQKYTTMQSHCKGKTC